MIGAPSSSSSSSSQKSQHAPRITLTLVPTVSGVGETLHQRSRTSRAASHRPPVDVVGAAAGEVRNHFHTQTRVPHTATAASGFAADLGKHFMKLWTEHVHDRRWNNVRPCGSCSDVLNDGCKYCVHRWCITYIPNDRCRCSIHCKHRRIVLVDRFRCSSPNWRGHGRLNDRYWCERDVLKHRCR